MSEKLVTVYTAYDPLDANLIRIALDGEGIPCLLDNERQAGLTGTMPIKVQVRERDAERARAFIRAHESAGPSSSDS